jgi:hypothetical protein
MRCLLFDGRKRDRRWKKTEVSAYSFQSLMSVAFINTADIDSTDAVVLEPPEKTSKPKPTTSRAVPGT